MTRHADLRRGEALNLHWNQIDWDCSRLTIIATDEWRPKDRDSRVVPIVPALYGLLLDAFEAAETGAERVIPDGVINAQNATRDFSVLCKHASVKRYAKPFHTLRKTCLTAWSREFPQHVVQEWAGHASSQTTSEYYLQVSEAEYDRAAGRNAAATEVENPFVARLAARLPVSRSVSAENEKGTSLQAHASSTLP